MNGNFNQYRVNNDKSKIIDILKTVDYNNL